jgi:VanZ family protein
MRLRVLSAVLWTVVILILCWTPQVWLPVSEGPESLTQVLHLDKFVHAGIFAVFSVLWLRALPAARSSVVMVALAGLALAALTEIVQNLPIINREAELEDALADFAGVLLGIPLFRWLEQVLQRWHSAKESSEVADPSSREDPDHAAREEQQ